MVELPPQGCLWEESFTAPYLEFAIVLPLIISFQILLLFSSLYGQHKYAKKTSSLQLRISLIFIQIVALIWTICDLLRFVVDPYTLIIRNSIMCYITAHVPRIICVIFYGIYLYQVLLRLYLSFKDSVYALSKYTLIFLSFLIIIPVFGILIAFIPFVPDVCIWQWSPTDLSSQSISICSSRNIGVSNIIIGTGFITVSISNIIFGVIFSMKVKKVLTVRRISISDNNSNRENFKLKSLIIKNYILTITASITTVISWTFWMIGNDKAGIGAFCIYIDLFINVSMLSLMLKYNENYYKYICKYCIKMCLIDCDKTIHKLQDRETCLAEMDEQQQYVQQYLEEKINLNKIFNETKPHQNTTNNIEMISLGDVLSDVENNTHIDDDDVSNIYETTLTPPISPQQITHSDIAIFPVFNLKQNSHSKPIIVE